MQSKEYYRILFIIRILFLIFVVTLLISLSTHLFVSCAFILQCIVVTFWKWSVTSNFASCLTRLPQGATFVALWTIGTLLWSPQLSSMTLLNILRGSLEIAFRNFSEMAKVSFCTSRVFCHFIVTNSLYHQSFRANPPIRKLAECRSPEKSKSSGTTSSHQKSVLRWGIYPKQPKRFWGQPDVSLVQVSILWSTERSLIDLNPGHTILVNGFPFHDLFSP